MVMSTAGAQQLCWRYPAANYCSAQNIHKNHNLPLVENISFQNVLRRIQPLLGNAHNTYAVFSVVCAATVVMQRGIQAAKTENCFPWGPTRGYTSVCG
jgi:predicted nucleotide-binding protein (sugar kinase/HSP70/actin superfamily)